MSLVVGRVTIPEVENVSRQGGGNGEQLTLRGDCLSTSLAATKAIGRELLSLADYAHTVIPVTWSEDSDLDGFYRLTGAQVDTRSLNDKGFLPFTLQLERFGSSADVAVQSVIVGTSLTNDVGITEGETVPFHALPPGFYSYDISTSPSNLTRTADDGSVRVFYGIDFTVDPVWSIDPADYYTSAAYITTGGYLRAGRKVANSPTSFELGNHLVKVAPGSGGTAGQLVVSHYDGSSWDSKSWRVGYGATTTYVTADWSTLAIFRNDAEAVTIRLVSTRGTSGAVTLDLTIRRGSRFLSGVLSVPQASAVRLQTVTNETGSTFTPTGASAGFGVRADANDAGGNRYIIGAPNTTSKGAVGYIERASSTMPFLLGLEVGGTGAATGDTADDLSLQYLGAVTEKVYPRMRAA